MNVTCSTTRPVRASIAAILFALLWVMPIPSHAVPATVFGTSDPWLAGMPDGSTASSGDVAPTHSPLLVSGLSLALGGYLTFTDAVGGVLNAGGCSLTAPYTGCAPIDGTGFFNHAAGAQNGISDVRAPVNALMGVFLDDTQPSLSAAPAALNFQAIGLDFLALTPELKQVFFVGNGLTSLDIVQQFFVPTGATRLFLGTMDGFGWFNNSGAIQLNVNQFATVRPMPEPGSGLLLLVGVAMIAGIRWSRKSQFGKGKTVAT